MLEWRTIPGFPDYQASSAGEIRRATPYSAKAARRAHRPRVLKGHLCESNGYWMVDILNAAGQSVNSLANRLVCLAFHGEPPSEGMHAAHEDGNRSHNSESNLRWATAKGNDDDQWRHGRHHFGESSSSAKLSSDQVALIRCTPGSQRALAKAFGISQRQVGRILNFQARRHDGRPV